MRPYTMRLGKKHRAHCARAVAALLIATPATCLAQAVPSPANHLADSADPYLRLHAHNPVDWYPWGAEAFAKAKAEGKPIFLSIGYSTCFWCHVAEKTIYSDPAIAALMNQWFVNVKVDREQRPDVDRLYIIATEMLTQHGAWPNNLFLTPDGKPFFAGSYFPPKDDGETMGFPRVLAAIHDLWLNHRADKVEPAAADLYGALQRLAAAQNAKAAVPANPRAWLKTASAGLLHVIDPINGGLGSSTSGQKFPQAPALDLLLAAATLDNDEPSRAALTNALEAMAYGGIHDLLGGGFHRYATDPTWTIPHFEKMLSDNAQLLALYTRAYAPSRTPQLRDMASDVAAYLLRDMQDPDGGFYTAQDAAIDGVEGASYLWTRAQIQDELGAFDTGRFLAVYEIASMPESDRPNAPGGVLRVRVPIEESVRRVGATDRVSMLNALATLRADLLTRRRDRPQPAVDKKIVTSLNGLTIGALARAGVELDRPDLVGAARKAADLIWSRGFDSNGRLVHEIIDGKAEVDGYIDDYAMLGDGFLALADATHDFGWRTRAARLADAMLTRFARPDGQLGPASGDSLLVTLGDDADGDVPSPTSAALALLAQLGRQDGGERFETAAAKLAVATSGRIAARPTAWPSAIAALARYPIAPAALAAAMPHQSEAVAASSASNLPRPPATSDHVHASATIQGDTIAVTLTVDSGYHINAHKPSLDYLVPTNLSFSGLTPAAIDYPSSVRFKSAFAPDGLDVYEGDVPLVARFPAGALSGVLGLEGRVTAQACDAKTCLPPAELAVYVRNGG